MKFSRSIRLSMAGLVAIAALSGCGGNNPAAPEPQLDTTPPPAPQNLTIAADASGAKLVWTDSSAPDVAGYQVYVYSASAGDFVAVGDGASVDNTYYLPIGPNNVAASYRVRAVDASGNWSAPSATADVLIPVPGHPYETQ